MIEPKLDAGGFRDPRQLDVLAELSGNPEIAERFYLTGGTALAAFYLGHRTSEDLDLFSHERRDLGDIDSWITRTWPNETVAVRRADGFLAVMIRDIKVDIVYDPLAIPGARPKAALGGGRTIAVDTVANIASNKLTALAARMEPKDYLDFYCLRRRFPWLDADGVFAEARVKDAQFEDPASVAFQIEMAIEGVRRIFEGGAPWADGSKALDLRIPIDGADLWRFYAELVAWLYARG